MNDYYIFQQFHDQISLNLFLSLLIVMSSCIFVCAKTIYIDVYSIYHKSVRFIQTVELSAIVRIWSYLNDRSVSNDRILSIEIIRIEIGLYSLIISANFFIFFFGELEERIWSSAHWTFLKKIKIENTKFLIIFYIFSITRTLFWLN